MKKILFFFFCGALLVSSCTRDTELEPVYPSAWLMVYNGAPDFYGINAMAFVNNEFYGNRSYNETGRGPLGAYNFSDYKMIDTGAMRIAWADSATDRENAKRIMESVLNFTRDKRYTVYLTDSVGYYGILFTQDDVDRSSTHAMLRLMNLSPDAGPVHLRLDTQLVPGIADLDFKEVTEYIPVTPDIKPGIRIMYYNQTTGEETTLTRKSFPLEAGKCYTMVLRGYRFPKDDNPNKTINLSTITNF
jgi:hypothetical protein